VGGEAREGFPTQLPLLRESGRSHRQRHCVGLRSVAPSQNSAQILLAKVQEGAIPVLLRRVRESIQFGHVTALSIDLKLTGGSSANGALMHAYLASLDQGAHANAASSISRGAA
jgi:hypothetical protein